MKYNNYKAILSSGFFGFESVKNLTDDGCKSVSKQRGVYLILHLKKSSPKFLSESAGGYFKRKNPTVDVSKLKSNWVEDTIVIYIGQAGGGNSNATLQKRLEQYMRFGQGIPVGHWGGRYIWQLSNNRELIVCWKPISNDDPREIEKIHIQEFASIYGKRPFANLTG